MDVSPYRKINIKIWIKCLSLLKVHISQFIVSHFCVFCIFFDVQKSQILNIVFEGKGALEVVEVEEEHE